MAAEMIYALDWRSPTSKNSPEGLVLAAVSKRFGPVQAVKGVSLAVKPGEIHALLGENGAGKSTLMGIASGNLQLDTGTISIAGRQVAGHLSPAEAQRYGLAIVHQHPATVPDLTVAENLLLAVPAELRSGGLSSRAWVKSQLLDVKCGVDPDVRMAEVDLAQSHLIELAKALAINPRVLILDEPTAPLTADLVEVLFEKVKSASERGAAVVYISHRLQEVRRIANMVTVMRDGEVKGSGAIAEMSDEDLLRLIVGRQVDHVFPAKAEPQAIGQTSLMVEGLSGIEFHDVTLNLRAGEIVGIAGISGNGQSEFIRALAGLEPAEGRVMIGKAGLRLGDPERAATAGIAYLSAERQSEGLFSRLSVRENAAFSALQRLSRFGVLDENKEDEEVNDKCHELLVRASSVESPVSSLSGGNQQKVVLARALLSHPCVVLAEEPTAGVDVGARAEIYRILRRMAGTGTPVLVVSSDLTEMEGLCDRVCVFSRGQKVSELSGEDVTEEKIGRSMMTATSQRENRTPALSPALERKNTSGLVRLRRFASGEYAPSLVLVGLLIILCAYVAAHNPRFVSAFNVERMLLLAAAVAFVGYGQMCTILTSGIDVSVGSLVGLIVVIASFFFVDGSTHYEMMGGIIAMLGTALFVGLVNGSLIRFGRFTAVAATLGTLVILQGISLLLRPEPGGFIRSDVIAFVQTSVSGIPIAFIAVVVVGLLLELALRSTNWGRGIRAVGSAEFSASRVGVSTNGIVVGAYVICSLLTALGGILVMAQLGIGDANQGASFTLTSIAAVALGGASLFGGRGSFVGVLFSALLIQIINTSTTFLGLSGAWQYWFIGGITLCAVALYSQVRA